ncbi:MAG: RDD family protein [Ignavibacteriales bacterium]|nr:RDD family protein [Ignavibacteriales bacterium]
MQPTQMQPPVPPPMRPVVQYAGFWRRFVAHLIDQVIVGFIALVLFLPALAMFGIGVGAGMMDEDFSAVGFVIAVIAAYLVAILAVMILAWLYFALMESSAKQATLEKLALGIVVTDLSGNRISFGRATGRYFGKIVSSMILSIGYIMAAFTEKKQALHDIMASCLVVMK